MAILELCQCCLLSGSRCAQVARPDDAKLSLWPTDPTPCSSSSSLSTDDELSGNKVMSAHWLEGDRKGELALLQVHLQRWWWSGNPQGVFGRKGQRHCTESTCCLWFWQRAELMSLLQERHTIPVYKLHQHWQTARLAEKGFLAELQPNKHAAFYKELLVQNQKLREFLELPPYRWALAAKRQQMCRRNQSLPERDLDLVLFFKHITEHFIFLRWIFAVWYCDTRNFSGLLPWGYNLLNFNDLTVTWTLNFWLLTTLDFWHYNFADTGSLFGFLRWFFFNICNCVALALAHGIHLAFCHGATNMYRTVQPYSFVEPRLSPAWWHRMAPSSTFWLQVTMKLQCKDFAAFPLPNQDHQCQCQACKKLW